MTSKALGFLDLAREFCHPNATVDLYLNVNVHTVPPYGAPYTWKAGYFYCCEDGFWHLIDKQNDQDEYRATLRYLAR